MFDFKLKHTKKDFIVREVPLMPELSVCPNSKYTYVWLKKEGQTTFEAMEEISRFFGLKYDDICNQGLKDENAITYQIISINKKITKDEVREFNSRYKKTVLQIEEIIGYGDSHVDVRSLHGNSFCLVIRNLEKKVACNFFDYCKNNRYISFVNYYDEQRFGMDGGPYNTHLIGKNIIEQKWDQAYKEFKKTPNMNIDLLKIYNKLNSSKDFFIRMNSKKVAFFVASYNSFLWNQEASLQVKKLNDGEYFEFDNIGNIFLPNDHNYTTNIISYLEGYEIDTNKLVVMKKRIERNLTITTTVFPQQVCSDVYHQHKHCIKVSFLLPTGCYATMFIKQMITKINK